MPSLPYIQALAALERDPLEHRVCLLLSDSRPIVAEISRLYLDAVVPHQRDFNVARLQCTKETPAAAFEALGEELPIMAERRLVVASDVNQLPKTTAARLSTYMADANPSTWFLLIGAPNPPKKEEGAEEASGIKNLADAVKKGGLVITSAMKPEELLQWLERELQKRGVRAGANVCAALIDRVGPHMTALSTEVEKLACFVGERKRIEMEDLDRMVARAAAAQIFHLTDAITKRDVSTALSVLTGLLDADEPPLRLLAFLTTQYRNYIRVKALQDAGATPGAVAAAMGWKSAGGALKTVQRMRAAELEHIVELLIRADQGMKSGKDPSLLLELLVMHMCRVTSGHALIVR